MMVIALEKKKGEKKRKNLKKRKKKPAGFSGFTISIFAEAAAPQRVGKGREKGTLVRNGPRLPPRPCRQKKENREWSKKKRGKGRSSLSMPTEEEKIGKLRKGKKGRKIARQWLSPFFPKPINFARAGRRRGKERREGIAQRKGGKKRKKGGRRMT